MCTGSTTSVTITQQELLMRSKEYTDGMHVAVCPHGGRHRKRRRFRAYTGGSEVR